jgi:hypothetical protein
MRKHFLLLLLMTLLPLATWAVDVEVRPFDAEVVWTGAKPASVQTSWITCTPSVDDDVKGAIAAALTIQDLAKYDVGTYTYKLQKLQNSVTVGGTTYTLMVSGSYSAELKINKLEGTPTIPIYPVFSDAELVYTGEAKALLASGAAAQIVVGSGDAATAIAVPVSYTLDPSPAEGDPVIFSSYDAVVATNAGAYSVYCKVIGTDNYDGTAAWSQMNGTKTIAPAAQDFTAEGAAPTANTWTYDAAAHALVIAPTNPLNGTYEYCATNSETDADWTTDPATITATSNADNKIVWWRVKDGNYKGQAATQLTATISKATPVINAEGVLNTAWTVYDGQNHDLLLKDATVTIGDNVLANVIRYKWRYGTSGSYSGSKTSYKDNAFKNKKNAGVYQINIYVAGTDDYNQVSYTVNGATPSINVAKADMTGFTAPEGKTGLKANGSAQDLITAASWGENTALGTFQYKVGTGDWSENVPQGTDAGDYSVSFQIVPTDATNYNSYALAEPIAVTIAAKETVTITIPANQSFGYGTTPTPEYTAVWSLQGEDQLVEGDGFKWNWFTDADGTTPAGPDGNGYYAAGDYYVTVEGLAVTGTTSASQQIVYPTAPVKVKITAGQIAATISGEAKYGVQPIFTLTHVSGLSTEDGAKLNENSTVQTVTIKNHETGAIVTYKDGDDDKELKDVAPTLAALATLNAGTYDLEATATYTPTTSYTILVSAGSLVVDPYTEGLNIVDIDAVEYKAAKWEPEVTVKRGTGETAITLTAGTDYTVAYGDNTHDNKTASTAAVLDGEEIVTPAVNTGIVKITGIGNYAGAELTKEFFINKATLTITADNFTGDKAWTYGQTEPSYTATVTGLKSENDYVNGTLAGIEGTLKVKNTSSNTVGMHTGALVAGFYNANDVKIEEPVATNYNLEFVPGNLQVKKGDVVIKLTNAVTGTYGDTGDALATTINTAIRDIENYTYVSGLSELEAANFASIIDVTAATYTLADAKYVVGTDYPFAIAGVTSTNYNVKVEDSAITGEIKGGIYKVNAAAITLKAKDQEVDYATATPNTTVSDATVEVVVSASEPGLRYEDALTDVIESIIIKTVEDQNVISLKAKTNANYSVTLQDGVLTVLSAAEVLEMTSDYTLGDNWFSTIESYNGKTVNVNITVNRTQTLPSSGKTYTWKAEDWNAFILPFDITPKELSEAFGYAIVNVVDPDNTKDGNIAFKLQMSGTIAANTPFMLKNYEAITSAAENNVIAFGNREIKAPANAEVSVDAGEDWKFIGSYNKWTINNSNTDVYYYNGEGAWKHLGATSANTWNIAPFNAYMLMPASAASSAREFTFTFEDLNGTTAIRSINEDATNTNVEGMYNLNGMKLNTTPTKKGVYIVNGKKVVIK